MKSLIWKQPGEISLVLALVLSAFLFRSTATLALSFVLFVLFFVFYRLPAVGSLGSGIVSPASGTVVRVKEEGNQLVVEIFLSPLDPHVQIVPASGKVLESRHFPGPDVDARLDTNYREKWVTRIRSLHGMVSVVQNTGLLARRLKNYCKVGSQACKGSLLGLIKFGSRVDLHVPRSWGSSFRFREGDKVRLGETLFLPGKDVFPFYSFYSF